LGGHKQMCTRCGHEHISYNSCRNRHCPKCQNRERELWMRQIREMLPCAGIFM
jgi:DNA-directed RNA polymerase subunit M/transcription elongation factor TFIIS